MSDLSLTELSKKIRDIDICILSTHSDGGTIAGRPMSNNRDVDYDGDSYYFTWEQSRMVSDIERDRNVALSFQGSKGLFGGAPFMVAVEGEAELVRDKLRFKDHWVSDLDDWFEQGADTPGVVMIKVHAKRIEYWDGKDSGEILV